MKKSTKYIVFVLVLICSMITFDLIVYNFVPKIPKEKPKLVVLFFDDGWKNQYTIAYPILKKYSFTATFGIIAESLFWNHTTYGFTKEQISDLNKNGMEIASHSHTHSSLLTLTFSDLLFELKESKKVLEEITQTEIVTFILPYDETCNIIDFQIFQIYEYLRPSGRSLLITNQTIGEFSSLVKNNSFIVYHSVENASLFEQQMQWLSDNSFKGISYKEWCER